MSTIEISKYYSYGIYGVFLKDLKSDFTISTSNNIVQYGF